MSSLIKGQHSLQRSPLKPYGPRACLERMSLRTPSISCEVKAHPVLVSPLGEKSTEIIKNIRKFRYAQHISEGRAKGSSYPIMSSEAPSVSSLQGRYVISLVRICSHGLEELSAFITKINPSCSVSLFSVNSICLQKRNKMFFCHENIYHHQINQ